MMPFQVLRMRPSGNQPWTPANLTSLVAWYLADNPLNTVVSGLMDTLHDKSGHGNNAGIFSSNAANRGQIWTNAQNGLPVWGYDTSARQAYFRCSNSHALASGNNKPGLSIFSVSAGIVNHSNANPGTLVNLTTGTSDASGRTLLARGSVGLNAVYGGGRRLDADSLQSVSDAANHGLDYIVAGTINDYSNSDAFVWVNGAPAGSSSSFQTAGTTSATNSLALNIGATGANINPHLGRIGEIILCSTALDITGRQKLEGYLAHRWGLAGSLPGGHPYQSAPPFL